MSARTDATSRFYDLLWPHRQTVLRTARLLLRDPHAADDLAQETMLKAFRSIGSFREGSDARAWLLAILRNARIDYIRSRASRNADVSLDASPIEPADERVTIEEHDVNDAHALLQQFSDADLISALQGLPEDIRWTLLLVDVEQLDHAEAAQLLDVPVGTVKSRAHRGRAMLRAALAPRANERKQS